MDPTIDRLPVEFSLPLSFVIELINDAIFLKSVCSKKTNKIMNIKMEILNNNKSISFSFLFSQVRKPSSLVGKGGPEPQTILQPN